MLAGLQMPDKNHDPVVLGFVHVHAIPSGNVLVFKVTIRPSGLGGHRNVVANHPSGCVVAFRREAGDTRFRERLTDPAVDDKGVAIVPRLAALLHRGLCIAGDEHRLPRQPLLAKPRKISISLSAQIFAELSGNCSASRRQRQKNISVSF